MSRGITETDVWTACDTLLLEGARPTIERVRLKIGRGSPNTVGPHLEAWFKHLGSRISDPGAFAAPPDIPEPVQQAARHFWETALAQTRRDFDQRLREAMAAAVANVESEKERATLADAAAFDASSKLARLHGELADHQARLEGEKLARATTVAHLANADRRAEELKWRLDAAVAELAAVRETSGRDTSAAVERAGSAERRASLEIDAERLQRTKAEQRSEALEQRLDKLQAEARAEQAQQIESSLRLQAEADRLRRELAAALEAGQQARDEIQRLGGLLAAEQRAAEHARGEASAARSLLLQLEPRKATRKPAAAAG